MQTIQGIPIDGVIAIDLPCFDCRYDLRTLRVGGQCPECGMRVEDTLRKNLTGADPRWLRTVRRGATMLAWAYTGLVSSFILIMVAAFTLNPEDVGAVGTALGYIIWILLFVGMLIGAIACVQLARRDRRGGRVSLLPIAAALCAIAMTVMLLLQSTYQDPYNLTMVFLTAWPLLASVHVRALCRRTSNRSLNVFGTIVVGVNLISVAGVAWWFVELLVGADKLYARPGAAWVLITLWATPVAAPVGWIAATILLFRTSRLLAAEAGTAEALRAAFEPEVNGASPRGENRSG